MNTWLQRYRNWIDSPKMPAFVRRGVERAGLHVFKEMFRHRHTRLSPYKIRHVTGDQVELWLDWQDYTDAAYIFMPRWSENLGRFMAKTVRPGDSVLDVGANVGYFTTMLSKLAGPTGKVIAVEPMTRNRYSLTKNVEHNQLGNVVIEPVAASTGRGELMLKYRYLNSGSPSTKDYFGEKDPVVDVYMMNETVPTKSVRDILDDHDIAHCRLMKMDIQGAEYDVLEAMRDSGVFRDKRVDYICVENNPRSYGNRNLTDLFAATGYKPYLATDDGMLKPAHKAHDLVFTHLEVSALAGKPLSKAA